MNTAFTLSILQPDGRPALMNPARHDAILAQSSQQYSLPLSTNDGDLMHGRCAHS